MKTATSAIVTRFSEQESSSDSLHLPIGDQTEHPQSKPSKPNASFHALLLRQALLRSQVQAAIYELVRDYELFSGYAVVRLDLQSTGRGVVVEAIPAEDTSQPA